MSTDTLAVAMPDLHATGLDVILRSTLYFDAIYADAFSAKMSDFEKFDPPQPDSYASLNVTFESQLTTIRPCADFVRARVLRPCPTRNWSVLEPFSTRSLPLALRQSVAASLQNGASLISYSLCSRMPEIGVSTTGEHGIHISDPKNIDNPSAEFAIGFHLISMFAMLSICSAEKALPLVTSPSHMHLIISLANHFPSVSEALGLSEGQTFKLKREAIAATVLREVLPPVKTRHVDGILALREEMQPELQSLRAEMGRLATLVQSEPWQESFHSDIEGVVAREVRPSYAALRQRLAHPSKRMLKHLVSDWKSICTSAMVPVAAYVLSNAPITWAILAGLAAGTGITALKAKVEEWEAKSSSSLAFLVEAEERLTK